MSSARKGFLKSALVILHIFSNTKKVRQFYPEMQMLSEHSETKQLLLVASVVFF